MEKRHLNIAVFLCALAICLNFSSVAWGKILYTSPKGKNFFTEVAPMNLDGKISVIVTAPVGATTMNAVDTAKGIISSTGNLNFLPAPFNMGIMPKATYEEELLPVVLLGGDLKVGQTSKGFAFGVIEFTLDGKAKKAILATNDMSPFSQVNNLEDLKKDFPGALEIIQAWFVQGYAKDVSITDVKSRLDALYLVGDSILEYANATITETDRRPMDAKGNPTLLAYPKSKNIYTDISAGKVK